MNRRACELPSRSVFVAASADSTPQIATLVRARSPRFEYVQG